MSAVLRLDGPAPRVFAVPPGVAVAEALAEGLRARLDPAAPEALARVTLLLDTRRAGRGVEEALERGRPATFLPRILGLAEAGTDAFAAPAALDALPRAADPARRRLTLTRLVAAFLRQEPRHGPEVAAPALARALAGLLDALHREGRGLDALDGTVPEEHAAHWQTTARFLAILREAWPAILAGEGAMDPEARRRAALEATVAAWQGGADPGAVVAAGSPGAAATSALLMAAVARLPQGAVVLPGFDPAFAADIWPDIGPEHPWFGHRALLDALGLPPGAVLPWTPAEGLAARRHLIGQALRPAPVTDRWLDAAPRLAEEAGAATAGLSLIEAPDPRREATAIALVLRRSLETPGTRAALVTPDRALARRVAATLQRWGIEPDDSGGTPLSLTPPGVFLRLLAEVAFGPFDPVALLALLKHPLCGAGARGAHLRAVRAVETGALRGRPEIVDLAAARAAAAGLRDEAARATALAVLDRIAALAACAPGPLDAMATSHRAAAQALAGAALWDKAAGQAAERATLAFAQAASGYGPCDGPTYPALFAIALDAEPVAEEAFRPDPRVAIWGTLEARMQGADLVVLGGLNEGTWPAPPPPDPWLSRPMRAVAGLPSPEALIGLGALDVLQAACGPQVVLTRAVKEGGAPTSPSRWLARLTTLLEGTAPAALAEMRARGAAVLGLVDPLERPAADVPPEPRPSPRPPVAARPARLSATAVETLVRDPYAIYARHVLKLEPLPPPGLEIDARLRGEVLHDALHRFCTATAGGLPDDPRPVLRDSLDAAMATAPLPPALRRLWRARLDRLADAFLAGEAARRAAGRPVAFEVKGRREQDGFTLTARADRIDRLADGRLALYDYKTGAIPSDAQVQAFARQLPLMGAIAEAGGFEALAAAPVARLAHVSLGGGKGAGAERPLGGEAAALVADTWAGLMRLVAAYREPGTGYPARARPQLLRYDSDYDHLSRLGEWEDGGD